MPLDPTLHDWYLKCCPTADKSTKYTDGGHLNSLKHLSYILSVPRSSHVTLHTSFRFLYSHLHSSKHINHPTHNQKYPMDSYRSWSQKSAKGWGVSKDECKFQKNTYQFYSQIQVFGTYVPLVHFQVPWLEPSDYSYTQVLVLIMPFHPHSTTNTHAIALARYIYYTPTNYVVTWQPPYHLSLPRYIFFPLIFAVVVSTFFTLEWRRLFVNIPSTLLLAYLYILI